MHKRSERLIGSLKIPTRYVLSTMGHRFVVYKHTARTSGLDPEAILRDPRLIDGDAPASR